MAKWPWVIGGLIVFGLIGQQSDTDSPAEESKGTKSTTASALSSNGMSQAECVRRVEQAQAAGIIKEFKAQGLNVIVDEATWKQIPFDAKRGMAETIGCAAVGAGKLIPLTFRSNLSNRVVGEYGTFGLKVM